MAHKMALHNFSIASASSKTFLLALVYDLLMGLLNWFRKKPESISEASLLQECAEAKECKLLDKAIRAYSEGEQFAGYMLPKPDVSFSIKMLAKARDNLTKTLSFLQKLNRSHKKLERITYSLKSSALRLPNQKPLTEIKQFVESELKEVEDFQKELRLLTTEIQGELSTCESYLELKEEILAKNIPPYHKSVYKTAEQILGRMPKFKAKLEELRAYLYNLFINTRKLEYVVTGRAQ